MATTSIKRFLWTTLLLLNGSAAFGQGPAPARSETDPRQTPTVLVYQRYKDAVIYLSGPSVHGKGQLRLVEEFFEGSKKRELSSLGSGFVLHESGYLLSNAHTVETVIAHSVAVGGKTYPADLLAVERERDMALLKIDVDRPLTAVKLARSGDILVGEPVTVIGNPFGLPLTCTTGVICALNRTMQPDGLRGVTLHNMLQTDAGINVGSSGGPWFNALGEVVGMTAVKRMNSDNIAFGVPVAVLRRFLPDMLDVEHRCGITTGLELGPTEPSQVTEVVPNSPAATAGIQPGDVLESLDGKPLIGRLDFCFGLINRKPQETLQLRLIRADKPLQVALTLESRAKPDGAALLKARCGLVAVPLDEEKAQATSMRVRRGVVITEVVPGTPWNYEKLESPPAPGDVLARIGSVRPNSLDHVGLLLEQAKQGQSINLVLLRRNGDVMARIDLTTVIPSQTDGQRTSARPQPSARP